MQLKLVPNTSEEDIHYPEEHDGLLHGTKVMFNPLQPWVNKQWRAISVDRYFALAQACDELKKRGLSFIGVAKKSTRGLCMVKLSDIELARRGL